MAICSYLLVAEPGAARGLAERLAALPACDVVRADNRDVLLLVTETPSHGEEERLRRTLESLPGVRSLVLTFGEVGTAGGAGAGGGAAPGPATGRATGRAGGGAAGAWTP